MNLRLVAVLAATTASLACIVVPARPVAVEPARAPAHRAIEVVGATYGHNCGVPHGNATGHVAQGCNGKSLCKYTVDFNRLGDPRPGCQKAFHVSYRCGPGEAIRPAGAPPEAGFGSVVVLDCR
jgi:hypothetical protein